eukprot:gnl/TRDRNA2_/TRDRNA2_34810_c0_seq1.p1 gnl/TRDRNA2_/TRDRNA2_34810_c0~~gnl/TRDRNA2_/TRDRNA2_34810_c0_seq1.p1  ORF type:complete len:862 (+),score=205.27 gnl/TRDRNA2_/TRDRNA2_34810_c0_seq1:87-2588(+)
MGPPASSTDSLDDKEWGAQGGSILEGRYRLAPGRPLGEGGWCVVRSAEQVATGRQVAVKTFRKQAVRDVCDAVLAERFAQEVATFQLIGAVDLAPAKSCAHTADAPDPRRLFVNLLDFSSQEAEDGVDKPGKAADGRYYTVLELAEESLEDCLSRRSAGPSHIGLREFRTIASSMAGSLAWLHSCNLCHLDIKPANIMRFGDMWKLIDLEGCIPLRAEPRDLSSDCFTALYACPELACCALKSASVAMAAGKCEKLTTVSDVVTSAKMDTWSAGVVLLDVLAHGCALIETWSGFQAEGMLTSWDGDEAAAQSPLGYALEEWFKWLRDPTPLVATDHISAPTSSVALLNGCKEVLALLGGLLSKDPEKRFSTEEFQSHPLLQPTFDDTESDAIVAAADKAAAEKKAAAEAKAAAAAKAAAERKAAGDAKAAARKKSGAEKKKAAAEAKAAKQEKTAKDAKLPVDAKSATDTKQASTEQTDATAAAGSGAETADKDKKTSEPPIADKKASTEQTASTAASESGAETAVEAKQGVAGDVLRQPVADEKAPTEPTASTAAAESVAETAVEAKQGVEAEAAEEFEVLAATAMAAAEHPTDATASADTVEDQEAVAGIETTNLLAAFATAAVATDLCERLCPSQEVHPLLPAPIESLGPQASLANYLIDLATEQDRIAVRLLEQIHTDSTQLAWLNQLEAALEQEVAHANADVKMLAVQLKHTDLQRQKADAYGMELQASLQALNAELERLEWASLVSRHMQIDNSMSDRLPVGRIRPSSLSSFPSLRKSASMATLGQEMPAAVPASVPSYRPTSAAAAQYDSGAGASAPRGRAGVGRS